MSEQRFIQNGDDWLEKIEEQHGLAVARMVARAWSDGFHAARMEFAPHAQEES